VGGADPEGTKALKRLDIHKPEKEFMVALAEHVKELAEWRADVKERYPLDSDRPRRQPRQTKKKET
jgi:hypothetical protein